MAKLQLSFACGLYDRMQPLYTGEVKPDGIDLRQLREQLGRPASSDHGRSRGLFDQIQRAHFRNTEVTLRDRASGLVVRTADLNVDVVRAGTGHIRGLVRAPLSVGDQRVGARVVRGLVAPQDCEEAESPPARLPAR